MRACVALLLFASVAAASPREEARRHFDAGSRLYRAAEYRAALDEFTAGYLAKPDPIFLFNIGQCDRMLGDLPAAIKHLRAYLEQMPNAENAGAVKQFIAEAQAQLAKPPPTAPAEPKVEPNPTPTPAPVETKSETKPRRPWLIGVIVAAAVVVVGAVVGVTLALVLPNDAAIPPTSVGNVVFRP
jgi:tetratricopeptide (TPR) repeat protein